MHLMSEGAIHACMRALRTTRAWAAPGTTHTHSAQHTCTSLSYFLNPYYFFDWLFSPGLLSHWLEYRRNRDNQHWNQCKINFCLYCNFLEFVVTWKMHCPHLINDTMPAEVTTLFIESITNIVSVFQHFLLHISCHVKKKSKQLLAKEAKIVLRWEMIH